MNNDSLRNELRASFKNRAVLYYLIFEELREEFGEARAIAILKRAIYRRGTQIGQQFREFSPKDLSGLKDAFLAIIPDEGRMFDPEVAHCDADSLVVHLNACPLKDAWVELGLDDHDKAVMCEIAGEIDKGTFEAAGFAFEPDTWQPGRTGCCHLRSVPNREPRQLPIASRARAVVKVCVHSASVWLNFRRKSIDIALGRLPKTCA